MVDLTNTARHMGQKEKELKLFLLDLRKRLRVYPSPNGFDQIKSYEIKRNLLNSNPDMPLKELNQEIKSLLVSNRITYADEMIKLVEEIFHVIQVIQQDEEIIDKNIIPNVIDASDSYHIRRLKQNLISLEKPLLSYLAYWKKIRKKGKFPLFSKYNKEYPSRFIDDMISKDEKLLEFTWLIIAKLSHAHTFTQVRRRR